MARRRHGRPLDGILVIDKPAGMTSNAILQQIKALYFAAKAGHTGSLDPLATGVLPICFGEATKFSGFLLEADKCYTTSVRLGVNTTTGDVDGEVVKTASTVNINRANIEATLPDFTGAIDQVPPMSEQKLISAVK